MKVVHLPFAFNLPLLAYPVSHLPFFCTTATAILDLKPPCSTPLSVQESSCGQKPASLQCYLAIGNHTYGKEHSQMTLWTVHALPEEALSNCWRIGNWVAAASQIFLLYSQEGTVILSRFQFKFSETEIYLIGPNNNW